MKTKVILAVIDGCRPDGLAQADTPHIDALWQSGAYTWSAQSVAPSFTLPTHTSMFRSVSPPKHGVTDNVFQSSATAFPSIMEVARRAGLHTAMFYSWEELRDLSPPGSLTLSYCLNGYLVDNVDQVVADTAAAYLTQAQPDLSLVYFCSTDLIGHISGWMSTPYLEAIENIDRALGSVRRALDQAKLRDQFTWLILADHGGHDHDHGSNSAEDLTIPWILHGPGVKRAYPIRSSVAITDTAATIAHLLGLSRPHEWDGKPVFDAFVG